MLDPALISLVQFHDKLRHDERGVLSMANSGPDTNGSQFFITFAPCTHLDNKHSVFGHVVGGSDVLSAMEREPVGDRDMPRRDLIIQDAVVYTNPFSQPDEAEAKELRRLELERLDAQPVETYGSTISISGQEIHRQGVGKYISASSVVQVSAADAQAKERAEKLKLEQAKAAAEQQQQTSDGADGAKKQRFSFKSFA
jgi:peptidyl-prolyl cis-trans isomerase-like protein 2